MFFMKIVGRLFPSLYLRTQKTEHLIAAYHLAELGLASEILDKVSWIRLLKTRHWIDVELCRRNYW